MTSKAKDVDTYIAAVPAGRRAAIEMLRRLCKQNLIGYEEHRIWPCYKRNGKMEIAFASQKQYIAFYVLKKEVLDGKGCVRFTKPEKIDFEVIAQHCTVASSRLPAPASARRRALLGNP